MKSVHLIAICILVLVSACSPSRDNDYPKSSSNPFEVMKVGMTYEEVESHLGKPAQITRGVSSLVTPSPDEFRESIRNLSSRDLAIARQELDFQKRVLDTTTDARTWSVPKQIETSGQLIYVTWVYEKAALDTFTYYRPVFKDTTIEVASGSPKYYVNNHLVTRSEYELVEGMEYRTAKYPSGWIISASEWLERKHKYSWAHYPDPVKATKRIVQPTTFESESYVTGVNPELYVVLSRACVIFDASSGRVVQTAFTPFATNKVASESGQRFAR